MAHFKLFGCSESELAYDPHAAEHIRSVLEHYEHDDGPLIILPMLLASLSGLVIGLALGLAL